MVEPSREQISRIRATYGLSRREASTWAKRRLARIAAELAGEAEIRFRNSRYFVTRRLIPATARCGPMIHLAIERVDGEAIGPERYRDFMRIRDELIGPGHEAVELYPRRAREVDAVNQYHLWAVASPEARFPFGFDDGRRVLRTVPPGRRKKRPFDLDDYEMRG